MFLGRRGGEERFLANDFLDGVIGCAARMN